MAKAAKKSAGSAAAKPGLSIVVPLYNEARGLEALHQRLGAVAARLRETRGLKVEIVYVDDGSRDDTLTIARTLKAAEADTQVVALSRNFGKEAALLAGLDHARLGAVLFLDGDGQHPPALIETLAAHWLDDGYDVVYTAKAHRANEPWLLRSGVHLFYSLINWGARQKIPEDAGDFRLLSPRAAAAPRAYGRTSWNIWSLLAFSIEGLTSFSVAPLRMASLLGVAIAFVALLFGIWILLETLISGKDVPGYPSLAVGIMVLGGVQLVMIGVLGEYIGKLLSEIKARPVYFVAEHQVTPAETAELPAPPPHATE
jgi:glycosyltransferase involved in cell wall biosynthesis